MCSCRQLITASDQVTPGANRSLWESDGRLWSRCWSENSLSGRFDPSWLLTSASEEFQASARLLWWHVVAPAEHQNRHTHISWQKVLLKELKLQKEEDGIKLKHIRVIELQQIRDSHQVNCISEHLICFFRFPCCKSVNFSVYKNVTLLAWPSEFLCRWGEPWRIFSNSSRPDLGPAVQKALLNSLQRAYLNTLPALLEVRLYSFWSSSYLHQQEVISQAGTFHKTKWSATSHRWGWLNEEVHHKVT